MGKGQDAKKNVKKEAAMTPKEKKAAKRLKKAKQFLKTSFKIEIYTLVRTLMLFLNIL